MFLDRRYRVGWITWAVPVGVLCCMMFSWFFVGSIPFIGMFLDKLVDLVLAFFVYKVLVHEAHRYREAAPYLPAAPRF
jgi:hypothetical protein